MAAFSQQARTSENITADGQVTVQSPLERNQAQQAVADILGAMSYLLHLHAHPYTSLEEAEHSSTVAQGNECG